MIKLDKDDIVAHEILAQQVDNKTLSAIILSIKGEYSEMKLKITEKEDSNYRKLLDIYTSEYMDRYSKQMPNIPQNIH